MAGRAGSSGLPVPRRRRSPTLGACCDAPRTTSVRAMAWKVIRAKRGRAGDAWRRHSWLSTPLLVAALLLSASPTLVGCREAADEAHPSKPAAPHPLWPSGSKNVYTFRITAGTSLGAIPSSGTVEVIGKLTTHVEAPRPNAITLRFVPSAIELVRPKGAASDAVARIVDELDEPFGAELEHGVLTAYLEPEGSSLLAFGLRRQLAAVVQRAEPSEVTLQAWPGEEWDASGRAQVQYTRDATNRELLHWKKTGYALVLATRGAQSKLGEQSWTPRIVESTGSVRVDDRGVVSIERKEALEAELTRGQALRSEYEVQLQRLSGVEPSAFPVVNLVRREVAAPPPSMPTDSLDQLRFAGRSWDEVLASVPHDGDDVSGAQRGFAERQAAFHALVGLFRSDPTRVASAKELIRKGDDRSDTLLRTLAAASTPASTAALAELASDASWSLANRQRAAAALLRAESPPPALLGALEKFLRVPELREHGLLGLGTFARRWRLAKETTTAERASQVLGAELRTSKTDKERATCLLAIANSGDAALFEQVLPYQKSQVDSVRVSAIAAIRLMKDERVEPTLRAFLIDEKRPGDLAAILASLEQRKPVAEETVRLVEARTSAETDPGVRRQAVLALANWRTQYPRLVDVLATLAASDPDARVREAAQLHAMR